MATSAPKPADSMKMTWRTGDKREWNIFHWTCSLLNLFPTSLSQERQPPKHEKTDKLPSVPSWQIHRWILFHALLPILVQHLYITVFHRNLHPVAMVAYYTAAFTLIGIHQINILRRLGERWGFLDGDRHERDGIPDIRVAQVMISLISTVLFRMVMAVLLTYKRQDTPATANWKLIPLEIALYGPVLDFWFYWYHRIMHENDRLWAYHRTHHLTKHPNPMLSLYADTEQEIFDIVGIPFLAWASLRMLGLPMGFYEWWICHQYVVFSELTGHSGIRVATTTPTPLSWLFEWCGVELVIEDHDLHHRQGWRKSANYGKHCRVWDYLFGTMGKRIESVPNNVDPDLVAKWPMFW